MNNKSEITTNKQSLVPTAISWLFGSTVLAIGSINTFWGNDPGFGIFLLLLAFIYFPPVNTLIKERFGFAIPPVVKIILGVFIIWAAVGVGELPEKIELMLQDIQ